MKRIITLIIGLVIALALGVIVYKGQPTTGLVNAQEAVKEVPFVEEWSSSGHADTKAEAFNHWNEESPAEVPVECARCHSTPGYQDFIGADGSAAGKVDKAAPIGTTVECVACHNKVTLKMTSVVMPSGIELTNLGDEARCMQCHQGRESTISVTKAISDAAVTDEDTISDKLGFKNIHYFAAAATKYGTLAKGGFEYTGKSYDGNFAHVTEFDTCIECHDSHTLQVKVEDCAGCHEGVAKVEDLKNVRMKGSLVDYDGDGNTDEGIYFELEGVRQMLYQAIQTYATEKSKAAIAYDVESYPYFFSDTNKNGKVDADEAKPDNGYKSWTPRLLKAAYNYQVSIKDPGAFAHGGKYIIELLYDSTEDLNTALSKPVDLAKAHRIDDGHFAGSEEAFRHWDADGAVPATCSKCHSADGLPLFIKDNATISQPIANGLKCTTCHESLSLKDGEMEAPRHEVKEVKFPSGAVIDSGDANTNLCMTCHQGRESTVSVNQLVEGLDADKGSEKLRFLNVHYFAAGATLFGTEAKGAYEYEGKTYLGRNEHDGDGEAINCTQCHSTHGLDVKVEGCADCHDGVATKEDLRTIRESEDDFDGDGNTDEGLAEEIDTMREALYTAMQDYAKNSAGAAIGYNPQSYPYFFIDTNGNGKIDPDEANGDNGYKAWTPRLLKAAYNYQYSTKDPGAFTHNGKYILQILYDSLEDVGAKTKVDMTKMVRP